VTRLPGIRLGKLSAMLLCAACGLLLIRAPEQVGAQSIKIGAHRARFIVLFLDETRSMAAQHSPKSQQAAIAAQAGQWEEMKEKAALIASRLQDQDALTVIGIDDHGDDPDDVRVPLTILHAPGGSLNYPALNKARQALKEQIMALDRRGEPPRTDIVGAIRQASEMANKESHARDVILAFFSDMQQTPKMPEDGTFKDIQFPQGTKAYCFYVDASKRYTFQDTARLWQRSLTSAGVAISENDFHQQGTVNVGLDDAFPALK
jgi:hypothetical protein